MCLFIVCEPSCLLGGIIVLNYGVFNLQGKVCISMANMLRLPRHWEQFDQEIYFLVDISDQSLKVFFTVQGPLRLVHEKVGGLLSTMPPFIHSPAMRRRSWWKSGFKIRSPIGRTLRCLHFRRFKLSFFEEDHDMLKQRFRKLQLCLWVRCFLEIYRAIGGRSKTHSFTPVRKFAPGDIERYAGRLHMCAVRFAQLEETEGVDSGFEKERQNGQGQ